jgi:hypothetical protein
LTAESPFKPGAEQGYPALERVVASGAFAQAGVTFVDGVHLFDAERAPVYIDNCCHYTRRGYEILADAIARAVVAAGLLDRPQSGANVAGAASSGGCSALSNR